jgi:hypothetical protein
MNTCEGDGFSMGYIQLAGLRAYWDQQSDPEIGFSAFFVCVGKWNPPTFLPSVLFVAVKQHQFVRNLIE